MPPKKPTKTEQVTKVYSKDRKKVAITKKVTLTTKKEEPATKQSKDEVQFVDKKGKPLKK